jgi:hypothetical protein
LKASGSRRAKITHTNRKKLIYSIFWSAGCSFFRADGFSCSLDKGKLQFLIKKDEKFSAVFSVFCHQNPGIRIGSGSGFSWNALKLGYTVRVNNRIQQIIILSQLERTLGFFGTAVA